MLIELKVRCVEVNKRLGKLASEPRDFCPFGFNKLVVRIPRLYLNCSVNIADGVLQILYLN